jgi:hypothetical protein
VAVGAIDDNGPIIIPVVLPCGNVVRRTAQGADDHPVIGIKGGGAPNVDNDWRAGAAQALIKLVRWN